MSTVIGQLEIQMMADMARLRQDMTAAKGVVGDAMADIQRVAGLATKALGLLGVGLSVGAFTSMIRGAIDGTAALKDMEQQTGNSAAALARFRSIGSLSETSMDSITGASIKLSKAMALQDEEGKGAALAIKALGLNFDEFRKLDADQRMLSVAGALAQYKDGADKSAAATLIFGKEGAKLLPFLADLAEQADEVNAKLSDQEKALRSNQAAMADAYGDNLTKLRKDSEAWKKDMAMGLLPALFEVSEALTKMSGGTGGLKAKIAELAKDGSFADWARGAVTALSYVVDVGQGLFSIIPIIGKAVAGLAAGSMAAFGAMGSAFDRLKRGDFAGAWQDMQGGFEQVRAIGTQTADDISAIWNQKLIGQTFRDTMSNLKGVQAQGQQAKKDLDIAGVLAAQKAAQDAAAEAAKRHADEQRKLAQEQQAALKAGDDLVRAIGIKNAALQQETDLGRALTAAEKELADLEAKLRDGKVILTDAQLANARAMIASNAELEAGIAWSKEAQKENEATRVGLDRTTAQLVDQVAKQREANQVMGLSADALAELEQAKLSDRAASLDRMAALMDEVDWSGQTGTEYRKQAQALRELAALKGEAVHLKAAKEAADEWKKTTDSIYNGLTDGLMRAFESGKGFMQAFRDTLVNAFKTLVLQPTIKAVLAPVSSAIGSLLGSSGAMAGTPGSAGSGQGLLGNLGSLSSLSSLGDMASLSSSFSAVASAAPYALAAYAVYKVLTADHNAKLGYGSTTGSRAFQFGRGTDVGQIGSLQSLAQAVLQGTRATASSLGGSAAADLGVQVATDIDLTNKGAGIIALLRGGQKVAGIQTGGTNGMTTAATKLDDAGQLTDWFTKATSASIIAGLQQSNLPERFRSYFAGVSAYALTSAEADAMLAAAQAAKTMADNLAPLGGAFGTLGTLSVTAADELAKLTGGLDAFMAKAKGYVADYYTQGEQMGMAAASVLGTLKAAGLDFSNASSRSDLRTLMDSLHPADSTERGQMAALLNVAADYAKIADYLQANGTTLGELAKQSPGYALSSLAPGQGASTGDLLTAQQAANASLANIAQASTGTATGVGNLVALTQTSAQLLSQLLDRVSAGAAPAADLADLADTGRNQTIGSEG